MIFFIEHLDVDSCVSHDFFQWSVLLSLKSLH